MNIRTKQHWPRESKLINLTVSICNQLPALISMMLLLTCVLKLVHPSRELDEPEMKEERSIAIKARKKTKLQPL